MEVFHVMKDSVRLIHNNRLDSALNTLNKCPSCDSKNVYINKQGYNAGSGAAGCCLCGLPGLLCGAFGGNKLKGKCLKCGKEFDVDSQI